MILRQSGGFVSMDRVSLGRVNKDLSQSPQIAITKATMAVRKVASAPPIAPHVAMSSVLDRPLLAAAATMVYAMDETRARILIRQPSIGTWPPLVPTFAL